MANTKKTQNRNNKSGKSSSSRKGARKKKNSSDDTMKFLLVLVIAGIAIALIFFSQPGEGEKTGSMITGTPTPTVEAGVTNAPEPTKAPKPTKAPEPTQSQEQTPTATPEAAVTQAPEPTATPAPANTVTPTPAPALSAAEAELVVKAVVDNAVYNVQLVNENLQVGNGLYYQFGAISGQEFVYPFLVVNKLDGTLHYYDSTEETVFDFTKFPLKKEATPTPTPTPAPSKMTVEEAYAVLCTYSKEALNIAKEVKEYDAEYDSELTLIDGIDCYRINLSEFSNGKVRNRGEFYISVDGTKCFYIDSNTNEFVEAEK